MTNSVKPNNLEKILCIRLSANGLSFSCPLDKDAAPKGFFEATEGHPHEAVLQGLIDEEKLVPANFSKAEVEIDTEKMVLLPNTAYEPGIEEGYLAVNNIVCGPAETVVVSPSFGVRVVMVAPAEAVRLISGLWGDRLTFSSPIIESIYRKKRGTVEVNLSRRLAYITVIEDKLDYAEVLPYESIADLLYYLKKLETSYDLQNCTILVVGHKAEEAVKKLSNYYRSVIGNAHYQW